MPTGTGDTMDEKYLEKQTKDQQAFVAVRQAEVAACQSVLTKANVTNISVSRSEMGCDVPLVSISMPGLNAHVKSTEFKSLKSFDLNSVRAIVYWIC